MTMLGLTLMIMFLNKVKMIKKLNSMTRKVRLNKSLEQFYTFDTFVKFVKKIDILTDQQIASKYSNKIMNK